jgi:hypothetical protein
MVIGQSELDLVLSGIDPVFMPSPSVRLSLPRIGVMPGSAAQPTAGARSRKRTGNTSPYMDAPTCPGFRALSSLQGEIAPVHSDFCCDLWVAVHDGFCWTVPHREHVLEVLRGGRVLPSTV